MHNLKHSKIYTAPDLQKEINSILNIRQFGLHMPIGFANGCFDLFHAGHAQFLVSAKEQLGRSGKLIIAVNSDASVRQNKGLHRPVISEEQRAYILACQQAVDFVFIFSEKTVGKYLRCFRPDIWFKGADYKSSRSQLNSYECNIVKKQNTQIKFVNLLDNISSTDIIQNIHEKNNRM